MMRATTGWLVTAAAAQTAFASGGVISLAGIADGASRIAEYDLTGSFAQINFGDGSPGDSDGLYSIVDPTIQFGSIDLFPGERSFGLGGLTYDAAGVTGSGVETVAVTGIDLGQLWAAGSATTDISDVALGLFFFEAPRAFSFGPLDANDTVTFVDGVLTSIDLEIDAALSLDLTFGGDPVTWDGSFTISGSEFSLFIDETEFDVPTAFGTQPQSRLVVDIGGTITAVPSPGAAGLAGVFACAIVRRRRR